MGIYRHPNGKDWIVDCHYQAERFRKKVGHSKRRAEQVEQKFKASVVDGTYIRKKKKSTTKLGDMFDQYLNDYCKTDKAKGSLYNDTLIKNRLVKYFGENMVLGNITSHKIQKYKAYREQEGVADATINRDLALLKHMFTKAIEWEETDENPVRKVKLYKEKNARKRYLTKEECHRVNKFLQRFS